MRQPSIQRSCSQATHRLPLRFRSAALLTFSRSPSLSFAMAAAPVPDIVLPNSPADTVSSLHFAPRAAGSTEADYLAATAWDGSVSVYEVSTSGQCVPRAKSAHAAPVLCSAWSADGSSVISGGCDNSVRLWNVATNQMLPVGTHEAPVRAVFDLSAADTHVPQICSGSWDKTVKYWDVRAPGPAAASVALSDRVYAMDVKGHVAAIACAERQIHIVDLRKPQEILKSMPSPLKFQSRSITIFPDQSGFALGSIEVRAEPEQNAVVATTARHFDEIAGATRHASLSCLRERLIVFLLSVSLQGRVAIAYLADPQPGPNGEPPPPVDPRNFAFKCQSCCLADEGPVRLVS